jgi:predicted DNA-binding protein with PD1-like motif
MHHELIPSSRLESLAFRGLPHQDPKQLILDFAMRHNVQAGAVLTAVGSLEQFHIRFANQNSGVLRQGHFEIVSLVGTFSSTACHLHISLSDDSGQLIGGHLLGENLIYTTAEIVVAIFPDLVFDRETDTTYNYKELVVRRAGNT